MSKFKHFNLIIFLTLLTFSCEQQGSKVNAGQGDIPQEIEVKQSAIQNAEQESNRLIYEFTDNTKLRALPPDNSLNRVKLFEALDISCPHCYEFGPTLDKLVQKYKKKLDVTLAVVPWRGTNVQRLVYLAELKGKEQDTVNYLYNLFHVSGIRNIDNLDVLRTVAVELRLISKSADFKKAIYSDKVTKILERRDKQLRDFNIKSTPTIILEGYIKPLRTFDNLDAMITKLLK